MVSVMQSSIVGVEPMADNEETKAQAFVRLGNPRVNAVLEKLRILGNLSSRSQYDYTPEQVDRVFARIRDEVDAVEQKFRGKQDKEEFSL